MSQKFSMPAVGRRKFLTGAGVGLAAVSGGGLISACSGEASGPTPEKLATIAPLERSAPDPSVKHIDGYIGPRASEKKPFHDGSKTFRIVVPTEQTNVVDWNKNKMTEWFEKRTGVKVQFDQVIITTPDGGQDLTKINAMLASGDLPDAFLGIPFTTAQISLFGQQGTFRDLTDLIRVYAPELRAMWKDYPDAQTLAKAADGKMYTFRGVNDCYHCKTSPGRAWVNTEYIEAVGGAMPKTTEDLRELLKLFKAKDPSPKKNIIPFGSTVGTGNSIDSFIMNSFLYNPGGVPTDGRAWMELRDGKVGFVAAKPEWREALKYLRTLFDDGSIAREAFTMTNEAMLQAGNQGRFGVARAYYWGTFADIEYKPNALWKKYAPIQPLKGPNGVQYAMYDHYVPYGLNGLQITSKCENPEILVQWADYQMELEAIMRGYGGEKDTNWRWGTDDQKGINDKRALYALDVWPAPPSTSWGQYSVMYRSNDFRLGQFIDPKQPNFEGDLYKAAQTYEPYMSPKENQVPPLLLKEDQLNSAAQIIPNVTNAVKTALAEFTTGVKDINNDADWNAYTASFQAMQLGQLTEILQKAYDERPQ